MPRNAVVFSGILLVLALFAGTTFATTAIMVAMTVAGILVVGLMLSGGRAKSADDTTVVLGPPALRRLLPLIGFSLAIAWRLSNYSGENVNPIQATADVASHGLFVVCLLLWCFRPLQGHLLMLGAGMIITLCCMIAGGASQTLLGQTTVALVACLGFLIASQLILAKGTRSHRPTKTRLHASRMPWLRSLNLAGVGLFSLLIGSALLASTSVLARVTSGVLPQIQEMLQDSLDVSLDALADRISLTGTRYVRGSRLGAVRQHMVGSPDEVAIRCYAVSPPGYLRGTVFDIYTNGNWAVRGVDSGSRRSRHPNLRIETPIAAGSVQTIGRSDRQLNRFMIRRRQPTSLPGEDGTRNGRRTIPSERYQTIEVHNFPQKGRIVFTALGTRWIEADAERLEVTPDDVGGRGVNFAEPYILGVVRTPPRQTVASERFESLQFVPVSVVPIATNLAQQLCDPQATTRGKAEAVAAFFQSQFEYSLEQFDRRRRRREDPIVRFLSERHPAHCEYFATATALILRQAGIPTRYVTGYVTDELSADESYYLARNRDAHAWVEAYDVESQRWFAVESTPGRSYQSIQFEGDSASGALGDDDESLTNGQDDDGLFSQLSGWLVRAGVADLLSSAFRLAQLPLFLFLAVLIWYRAKIRRQPTNDPTEVASRRMLRQVDRIVMRHQLIRSSHETLHQFAQRIDGFATASNATDDAHSRGTQATEGLTQAAEWYRRFATDRYQGQLPTPLKTH